MGLDEGTVPRARVDDLINFINTDHPDEALDLIKKDPSIALTGLTDLSGRSLLILAVTKQLGGVVQALLDNGASPDLRGLYGETPLHWASSRNNAEIVQRLLDKDADPNAQDENERTPLHIAIEEHDPDAVRALLEMGADPTAVSKYGDTPESLARREGNPAIIDLLDDPPALRQKLSRRQARMKFDRLAPDNDRRAICSHFKGVLWYPRMTSKPRVCRVWDLIYGEEMNIGFGMKPANRWIHVPSNNPRWLQHVVQKIIFNDYQDARAKGQGIIAKVDEFIEQQFPETGERTTGVKSDGTGPGLKLLSLVVPTLDIDVENDTRAKLCKEAKESFSEEAKRHSGDERNLTLGDNALLSHIRLMDEMHTSYLKLGIHLQSPRSIYEPHNSSGLSNSSKKILQHRIKHQVLRDYLQISKRTDEDGSADKHTLSIKAKRQNISPYQNDRSNLVTKQKSLIPTANTVTDELEDSSRFREHRRESLRPPLPQESLKKHNGPSNRAGQDLSTFEPNSQQRKVVPASSPEGKAESILQGIVIPHLWVLMIYVEDKPETPRSGQPERSSLDENSDVDNKADPIEGKWTIITTFPERWNSTIAPSLQSRISKALYPKRVGIEEVKVTQLIEQMLFGCINFIEETIILSKPVLYSNLFTAAIAKHSDDLAYRYEQLKGKVSSIVKYELDEEVTHLKKIDDIIYELDVIKRVLNEQEHIMDQFKKEIGLLFNPKDSGSQNASITYVHPALKVFDGLGAEARRVRESLITLLDLKQRFATIEDARLTSNQTAVLIIFTVVTVIFSPLLFTVAILALKVNGLPDTFDPGYIAKACVSSFAATVVLIGIFLGGYMIYSAYIGPKKERSKTGGDGETPPPHAKATEKQKGGKESKPLVSWQNTVVTKSNKLLAHLKFRNPRRYNGQKDEENGKPVVRIKGKGKEAEK